MTTTATRPSRGGPSGSAVTGTRKMVRLALRRDRITIPLWLVGVLTVVASTVGAFANLYPDVPSRLQFAQTVAGNPTFRALAGKMFDGSTIGGLTAWRVSALGVVILGLMSIFLVTRHTRQEEETGRLELLGATVLGRRAPLVAALLVACGANLVAFVAISAIMIRTGNDVAGSVALGASLALGGLLFAGVAAVTAQLTESTRTATGVAAAVLGAGYVLRAVGDSAPEDGPTWLSWLSPMGIAEEVRPFAGNRWPVAGLLATVTVLLALVAWWLNERRDFGASLFSARRGPANGTERSGSAGALAWRLQRGSLIGWTCGFLVLGLVYGSIVTGLKDMLSGNAAFEEIIRKLGGPGALTDAFLSGVMGMLGLIAAAYGVSAMLRLRGEETAGRVEALLATPTSRAALLTSHLVFAIAGPVLLLAIAGVATGITANAALGDGTNHLPGVLAGALSQLPAVWVLVGVAAALIGWAPRFAPLAWAALAAVVILGQLGPILQLPPWLMNLSPFTHLPKLPGTGAVDALPVAMLVVLAGVLVAAGFIGFRRRDID